MLLPLHMQYIGEEAFFAITTYEMLFSGDWTHATLYGWGTGRFPVFQWVATMFAHGVGAQNMEVAIRLVSVTATWFTVYVVGKLAQCLCHSREMAWLTALIFLASGESMFWYGWLGYSDALFSCFIFFAIALLWISLEKEQAALYMCAWLMVGIAVLVKALTAYAFFGVAVLVLATGLRRWRFILRPSMVLGTLCMLATPWVVVWLSGDHTDPFYAMLGDVTKHHSSHWIKTVTHILYFPLESVARVLPFSLLIILMAWQSKGLPLDKNTRLLLWIIGLNYLPYWLNATASPRYIIPLYPLVALLFTIWLSHADDAIKRWGKYLIVILIVAKIPFSIWILPYAKGGWRADHNMNVIAASIIKHADGRPILSENDAASGMGVAAYVDRRLFPEHIVLNPSAVHGEAYILTYFPKPRYGELVQRYTMHGDAMYLYHRQ